MPYRKPPSKAEMSAFRKAQTVKNITPEQLRKVRDAFRKKHDYYATGAKAKVESDDEKSRAFGAFQIAEIRQLVKAHNRINDLVLPRKLNKKQMIDLIYERGYRLDSDKRRIIQIRRPKRDPSVSSRTAMMLKDDPDSSKRTTYSQKVK